MKWRVFKLVVVIATLFTGVSFADEYGCTKHPDLKIALMGDSLIHGRGVGEGIISYIDDAFGSVVIIDYSREGSGVLGLMFQISKMEDEGFMPTHVVIYTGVNDCLRPSHDNMDKRAERVEVLLDFFLGAFIEESVFLVKHHPWSCSKHSENGKYYECSVLVNSWIEGETLMVDGATVVDTSILGEGNCLPGKHDAGDGLHLNRKGQFALGRIIAMEIFDEVIHRCW